MHHQMATCPVCSGTGRVEAGVNPYKTMTAGYDRATDTLPCRNCGGQIISMRGTGQVRVRADGTACVHEYDYRLAGRCYHEYTCRHCGHQFYIDSGD
jgi:DNA-directed RNA polymerase subunit RPC12/RpoP